MNRIARIVFRSHETRAIFFYGLIGLFSLTSDFFLFYFLRMVEIPLAPAQLVSYLFGTTISFFLNARVTFGISTFFGRRLLLFMAVALGNSLASSWLIEFFAGNSSLSEGFIKAMVTTPLLVWQYLVNRLITFRQPG